MTQQSKICCCITIPSSFHSKLPLEQLFLIHPIPLCRVRERFRQINAKITYVGASGWSGGCPVLSQLWNCWEWRLLWRLATVARLHISILSIYIDIYVCSMCICHDIADVALQQTKSNFAQNLIETEVSKCVGWRKSIEPRKRFSFCFKIPRKPWS